MRLLGVLAASAEVAFTAPPAAMLALLLLLVVVALAPELLESAALFIDVLFALSKPAGSNTSVAVALPDAFIDPPVALPTPLVSLLALLLASNARYVWFAATAAAAANSATAAATAASVAARAL